VQGQKQHDAVFLGELHHRVSLAAQPLRPVLQGFWSVGWLPGVAALRVGREVQDSEDADLVIPHRPEVRIPYSGVLMLRVPHEACLVGAQPDVGVPINDQPRALYGHRGTGLNDRRVPHDVGGLHGVDDGAIDDQLGPHLIVVAQERGRGNRHGEGPQSGTCGGLADLGANGA